MNVEDILSVHLWGGGGMHVCVCVCVCVCQAVGCKTAEHSQFLAYCVLEANSTVWTICNISHNVCTDNDVSTVDGRCCRQNLSFVCAAAAAASRIVV
jgi:hypothetical protein